MKTRTKRILVLIGAMGLFAGAFGCGSVNPFPDDEWDYRLEYQEEKLLVTFEAEDGHTFPGLNPSVTVLNFSTKAEPGNDEYETNCEYTSGDFVHGGPARCEIEIPQNVLEAVGNKIVISVNAEGTVVVNGETRSWNKEKSSPDLNLNRATIISTDADTDGDGVLDENDNCIEVANPDQSNIDCDDYGDVCDGDIDNDGVENDADACDSDPDDAITDIEVGEDGCPIAPDDPTDVSDTDGDGVNDFDESGAPLDNCPDAFNDGQADGDGDGIGDACDVAAPPSSGGPGDGTGPGGMNPFGPGGPVTGANMTAESGCALMETAAFNPALFILLCAALLPIAALRRR